MGIILDADDFILKEKKKKIMEDLDELEIDEPVVMISEDRPKPKKKKKKIKEEANTEEDVDDWLATVANFKSEPIRKKCSPSNVFNYYNSGEKKHKKHKKKKDGELTDYNKEFDAEARLIQELMKDQSRFVDALQKRFDALEQTKSSARGVGKFTTDLIESINAGRKLSLDLVKEQATLKKTIADLSMKEKEKFGSSAVDNEDLSLYSSSLLKKMIADTQSSGGDTEVGVSSDVDMDALFEDISNTVGPNEDDEEIGKYLQYESANVTVYACINEETGVNYFVAKDAEDNIINDYPLPEMTDLNINRSTNVATDIYSRKYPIIWVG